MGVNKEETGYVKVKTWEKKRKWASIKEINATDKEVLNQIIRLEQIKTSK